MGFATIGHQEPEYKEKESLLTKMEMECATTMKTEGVQVGTDILSMQTRMAFATTIKAVSQVNAVDIEVTEPLNPYQSNYPITPNR